MSDLVEESDSLGPFTVLLQSGQHPMSLYYFKLEVLDRYFNDPRYYVRFFDFGGRIGVREDYNGSHALDEPDRIRLQRFGLAYSEDKTRGLGVFLVRLTGLTASHQLHWQLHQIQSGYKIVPDYYRTSIEALPPEFTSAYQAFLHEQITINAMARDMGKPNLFRETFPELRDRPSQFNLILRPTWRRYSDFIQVVDKLLSDNIDRDFFRGDISLQREIHRSDGRVEVLGQGTITLLKIWLESKFPSDIRYIADEVITPLRKIRGLRQNPAHTISPDDYDPSYFDKQNELILAAYGCLLSLRKLLHTLPELEQFKTPDWLDEAQVVVY